MRASNGSPIFIGTWPASWTGIGVNAGIDTVWACSRAADGRTDAETTSQLRTCTRKGNFITSPKGQPHYPPPTRQLWPRLNAVPRRNQNVALRYRLASLSFLHANYFQVSTASCDGTPQSWFWNALWTIRGGWTSGATAPSRRGIGKTLPAGRALVDDHFSMHRRLRRQCFLAHDSACRLHSLILEGRAEGAMHFSLNRLRLKVKPCHVLIY